MIKIDMMSEPMSPSKITMDFPNKLIGAMSPKPTVEKTTTLK